MTTGRKFLLTTTMITGLVLLAPSLADAQEATAAKQDPAEDATTDKAPPETDHATVEDVVVTGSRIRRSEFTSPSPIQVITSDQANLKGVADTTELLQVSSLASGSFQVNNMLTGYVVDGGSGVNTISLRGLGSNRTLVLVDGRRMGPAGVGGTVGPVDLNVLPQSMIERVEILKDGASSIYGSDAVAGVVNVITKKNLDGATLNIYGNKTFQGGGDTVRINGAWGRTFDKGYVSVGADYYEQTPLRRGDRDATACAADYLFDATTRQRVDYTDSDTGGAKCYNLVNNVIATTNGYGTLQYLRSGVTYPTAAQGNNSPYVSLARQARAGYAATFPYASYETPLYDRATVISPVRRYSLTANAGYDIAPGIEAYGQLMLNRRVSSQDGVRQLFPTISTSNPNAYVDGLPVTGYPIIALKSDYDQTVDYVRGVAGLRGSIPQGGLLSGWDWDVYANVSHSYGEYTKDIIYNDRVVATTGASACNQAAITISGGQCSDLPAGGIPWFSQRIVAGGFNAAEKAFLFGRETGPTSYDQQLVEGSLSGDLWQLPAGMMSSAVGFSVRHEKIDDMPGYNTRNSNLWGQSSAGATAGDDTVKEAFGELAIPLIKGVPLIELLDLQMSGRYTDYDSYGSNTTWKLGLNWQITPEWRMRATRGTSFRAPSLYELYLANQTSYLGQGSVDPCINYQDSTSAILQANCAAAGVPAGYTAAGNSSATIITGGGVGILKAETSMASTVGLIWTPEFADLQVALDYFDIEVNNEIRQFGAYNIVSQCYTAANPATSAYCTLFNRDASTHAITSINNSYVNVASQINQGLDLTVRYGHAFDFGKLTLNGQFTWQLKDTTQLLGSSAVEDYNGTTYGYDGPDFSGQINARLARGDWTYGWSVDMIGKGSDTDQFGGDTFYSSRYARYVYYKQYTEFTAYHTASVRRVLDDYTIEFGIQDLFDEGAPSQSTGQFRLGTAAINGYDLRGRRGFVNLTKTW